MGKGSLWPVSDTVTAFLNDPCVLAYPLSVVEEYLMDTFKTTGATDTIKKLLSEKKFRKRDIQTVTEKFPQRYVAKQSVHASYADEKTGDQSKDHSMRPIEDGDPD